jgi:hypothetical protein
MPNKQGLKSNSEEKLMKKGMIVIMLLLFIFVTSGYSCGGRCPHGVCEKPEGVEETK